MVHAPNIIHLPLFLAPFFLQYGTGIPQVKAFSIKMQLVFINIYYYLF